MSRAPGSVRAAAVATLVLAGAPAPATATPDDVLAALRRALEAGHERKDALRLVAGALADFRKPIQMSRPAR